MSHRSVRDGAGPVTSAVHRRSCPNAAEPCRAHDAERVRHLRSMRMRGRIAFAALCLWLILAPAAVAAQPVEGYRSADNRVGCVMYQGFDADGNAVKCGRRGFSRGLLLT